MKKFRTIIILAIVVVTSAFAADAQIRFGVKAGLNVNKLSLKNLGENVDSDNGCGFTGGVMTEIGIPLGGLAVDASFMYTHMTDKTYVTTADPSTGTLVETELHQSKNFLEIPINLKYKIGLPVVSPYILTGPTFSFKMGDGSSLIRTKDVQYSWNFGLGLEVIKHLQVQAAYSLGINNILKTTGLANNPVDDIKLKNNYWTITAAYLF